MSQRSPASGPPSNAPHRDSQPLPPLSPSLSRPPSARQGPPESPYTGQPPAAPPRTTLPPLGYITSGGRLPPLLTDQPPSRPLDVHSILNPAQHDLQGGGRAEFLASSRQQTSPAAAAAGATAFAPVAKRPLQASPTAEEVYLASGGAERRILTPKSPGLRSASAGGRQSYTPVPFGATQSPSMKYASRPYATEAGPSRTAEVPPLPHPTSLGRSSGHYPSLTESAPRPPRRPSSSRNPFAASGSQAQGESPSTSHSSYSHFSQSSPILRYGPPSQNPSSLQPTPARPPASLPPGQQSASGLSEGQYDMSKGSYGISIPTEGGQMLLPVELDVEQASKTANEKRKRNAGASARFRQRRKEKEREASQTISSLERNLRGLEDERNHYRSERDFFRDLYARQVGPAQLPQRPLTPRLQALSRPSLGDTPPQWQDISGESSEPPPRSIRRRTSSYPATFPPAPPTASPMLPPQGQSYAFGPPPPPPPPPPPSGVPILQNPFAPTRAAPTGPPFAPQQPPPPSPHPSSSQDPFRRDSSMYSRSWNPGPH